jgi:hypothetical protein
MKEFGEVKELKVEPTNTDIVVGGVQGMKMFYMTIYLFV